MTPFKRPQKTRRRGGDEMDSSLHVISHAAMVAAPHIKSEHGGKVFKWANVFASSCSHPLGERADIFSAKLKVTCPREPSQTFPLPALLLGTGSSISLNMQIKFIMTSGDSLTNSPAHILASFTTQSLPVLFLSFSLSPLFGCHGNEGIILT